MYAVNAFFSLAAVLGRGAGLTQVNDNIVREVKPKQRSHCDHCDRLWAEYATAQKTADLAWEKARKVMEDHTAKHAKSA